MKKILFTIAIALLAATSITSQENAQQRNEGRRHFSPEEFQTKQREYITEKAQLTAEEAEASHCSLNCRKRNSVLNAMHGRA